MRTTHSQLRWFFLVIVLAAFLAPGVCLAQGGYYNDGGNYNDGTWDSIDNDRDNDGTWNSIDNDDGW